MTIEAPTSPKEIPFAEFVALRERLRVKWFRALTEAEHTDLIRRTKRGEKRATELLVMAHERLLRRYVEINKSKKRGFANIDIEESMQEARIALLSAAKSHDAERGKFSTYLFWSVKQTARQHNSGDPIIWIDPARFGKGCGNRIDRETLAICRNVIDFDAPTGDDEDSTVGNAIALPEDDVETLMIEGEERQRVREFVRAEMNGLDARDRTIMEMRWFGEEIRSLEEVGQHFDISRERVRQIEARIFAEIRKRIDAFRSKPSSSA